MKNLYLRLALLTVSQIYYSQVGIGTTTPNPSAVLDLDATSLPAQNKKGVLLPRLALLINTDTTTIPNPAAGLLVYNTANNGSGTNSVVANTFYYWNGTNWTNLSNISEVKKELLPQVFFLAEESHSGSTTPQHTVSGTDNINTAPVLVNFSSTSVLLNTGNNVSLQNQNNFKINGSGDYEISGFLNYRPSISASASTTNIEFIVQKSIDNGTNWVQVAKTIGVWGYGTTQNSRTNNIPPTIINLNQNDLIRCIVFKTAGDDHGVDAEITSPTGLPYGKVLKIQKLN
jgi:hypothetical protein